MSMKIKKIVIIIMKEVEEVEADVEVEAAEVEQEEDVVAEVERMMAEIEEKEMTMMINIMKRRRTFSTKQKMMERMELRGIIRKKI